MVKTAGGKGSFRCLPAFAAADADDGNPGDGDVCQKFAKFCWFLSISTS